MVVDSHCHLDFDRFDNDRSQVIRRARDEGVEFMINSGVDYRTNKTTLELAEEYEFIHPTLGFSPNYIFKDDSGAVLEQIRSNAHRALAVGEVGLDYYHCRNRSGRDKQEKVFKKAIDLARDLHKPLVIHARDSEDRAFELVKDAGLEDVVFHCYSGTAKLMREIAEHGYYISMSTMACFVAKHRVLLRHVPLDKLFLETDSPFLSPRRGRNEPGYIVDLARQVARQKRMDVEEVEKATTENVRSFYGL